MDPISAASAVGIAVGVARLALEVYQKGFTRLEQAAPARECFPWPKLLVSDKLIVTTTSQMINTSSLEMRFTGFEEILTPWKR